MSNPMGARSATGRQQSGLRWLPWLLLALLALVIAAVVLIVVNTDDDDDVDVPDARRSAVPAALHAHAADAA